MPSRLAASPPSLPLTSALAPACWTLSEAPLTSLGTSGMEFMTAPTWVTAAPVCETVPPSLATSRVLWTTATASAIQSAAHSARATSGKVIRGVAGILSDLIHMGPPIVCLHSRACDVSLLHMPIRQVADAAAAEDPRGGTFTARGSLKFRVADSLIASAGCALIRGTQQHEADGHQDPVL